MELCYIELLNSTPGKINPYASLTFSSNELNTSGHKDVLLFII